LVVAVPGVTLRDLVEPSFPSQKNAHHFCTNTSSLFRNPLLLLVRAKGMRKKLIPSAINFLLFLFGRPPFPFHVSPPNDLNSSFPSSGVVVTSGIREWEDFCCLSEGLSNFLHPPPPKRTKRTPFLSPGEKVKTCASFQDLACGRVSFLPPRAHPPPPPPPPKKIFCRSFRFRCHDRISLFSYPPFFFISTPVPCPPSPWTDKQLSFPLFLRQRAPFFFCPRRKCGVLPPPYVFLAPGVLPPWVLLWRRRPHFGRPTTWTHFPMSGKSLSSSPPRQPPASFPCQGGRGVSVFFQRLLPS